MSDKVRLQGIGWFTGTPADELKVGDVLVWNYGHRSTILGIEPKGKLSLTLRMREHHDEQESSRVVRKTRLLVKDTTV